MAYTFKHGDRPVDGYTIQRAVGKGGFGEVYYAISDGGREVALKYLRDNPAVELRGVSHCINLKSPHLVSIFDVKKTTDGEYAIIMEYCSGPSLRDLLIAEPNGFGADKAAFFIREIAKGLAYLHDRGIVHRDLKPGNLFYDDGYVKIGDYGLSKFISVSRHSGQTASVGTVHYMAPEIGSGNYSRGVDIYALGVILYEMLLGKVPFEGSSMAEVLMKHLTTQPELDELPAPFGAVIRRALEKDPNDRYPSVDDMVSELLEADEVRESVAGFSPQSLEGAVRHGARAGADSPIPSPNPMPQRPAGIGGMNRPGALRGQDPPFAQPLQPGVPLPDRLAKRMQRVSKRIDARMAKLAGRHGRHPRGHALSPPSPPYPAPPPQPRPEPASGASRRSVDRSHRGKRMVLSGLLSLALAIGLGILVTNSYGRGHRSGDMGVAASMLTLAMAGGVLLSRRVIRWFDAEHGPSWSQRMITVVCCAPLMAIGATPIFGHANNAGVSVYLGLLLLAVCYRWQRSFDAASEGKMSFVRALGVAFCALICTAIASAITGRNGPDDEVLVAAGIAGAVSLIMQATAWWLPNASTATAAATADSSRVPLSEDTPAAGRDRNEEGFVFAADIGRGAPRDYHADTSVDEYTDAGQQPHPQARWGVTRAFWGLITFALMGGTIVTFLLVLIAQDFTYDDITGVIVGCTACFALTIFALRKTTPLRRVGFWREWLRPFLISLTMFGIGGTITGIAREWSGHLAYGVHVDCLGDEGRVALLTGLILSSLLFLGVTLFTGRKPRAPKPFVQGSDHGVDPSNHPPASDPLLAGPGSSEHESLPGDGRPPPPAPPAGGVPEPTP